MTFHTPEQLRAFKRRNAQIVREIRAGLSIDDAAARFKLRARRIRGICGAGGLRLGPKGNAGIQALKAELRRRIAATAARMTLDELAAKFGVSRAVVQRSFAEHGVRTPRPHRIWHARVWEERASLEPVAGERLALLPEGRCREIGRLLLTTRLTLGQIGGRVGVTPQRVAQVWRDLKLGRVWTVRKANPKQPPKRRRRRRPPRKRRPARLRKARPVPPPAPPPLDRTFEEHIERFGVERRAATIGKSNRLILWHGTQASYRRTLAERESLRPRATELINSLRLERHRQAATFLLATSLTMEQIGKACGMSGQTVHQVWTQIRVAPPR